MSINVKDPAFRVRLYCVLGSVCILLPLGSASGRFLEEPWALVVTLTTGAFILASGVALFTWIIRNSDRT